MYFEKTYHIDTRDLDCFNFCRASAVLGYLQDAAGLAAGAFGATNDTMVKKYDHCWMVARTRYTLDAPLRWGDGLTVKTWHRGGDKPLMFRDFDLLVDGRPVGQALSVWVLVNRKDRSITRPNVFPEFAGTDGGALIRETKLPKRKPPAGLVPVGTRQLHYSDTDANGHVNNTRYADFLCDAAQLHQSPPGTFVRELFLSYLQECRAGETLSLLGVGEDEGYTVLGQGADGGQRFLGYAAVSTSPAR